MERLRKHDLKFQKLLCGYHIIWSLLHLFVKLNNVFTPNHGKMLINIMVIRNFVIIVSDHLEIKRLPNLSSQIHSVKGHGSTTSFYKKIVYFKAEFI